MMGPKNEDYYKKLDGVGDKATWMSDHVFRVTLTPGFLGNEMSSLESILHKVGVPKLGGLVSYEENSKSDASFLTKAMSALSNIGSTQAYFTEVQGLGMDFDYEDFNEGGSTVQRHFFKGPKKKNLIFKYGMIVNSDTSAVVQGWCLAQRQGIRLMFNGTIELLSSADFATRRTWQFMNARLASYAAANLTAGENTGKDIIETLTFIYNGCY